MFLLVSEKKPEPFDLLEILIDFGIQKSQVKSVFQEDMVVMLKLSRSSLQLGQFKKNFLIK